MKTRSWFDLMTAAALAVALGFAASAPPEQVQGDLARLMYVHVPSAWLAYLAFTVTLIAGIVWLVRKDRRWDHLAASSAEVGVFFTALALLTGMIWGRPTWGTWWEWGDARMTTTALMFLVYLGYLGLRRAESNPLSRARRSALMGTVAFSLVPIVHFSVVWWRTLHQPPTFFPDPTAAPIDRPLLIPLFVGLGAFTLVYVTFVRRRMELARLEARLEEAEEPLAATTVRPPGLTTAEDV